MPHPPSQRGAPVLSQSGQFAAVIEGVQAAIVTTATGKRVDVALPASGGGAAFVSDDKHVAICAGGEVDLLSTKAPKWPSKGVAELAGGLFRLALVERFLVAVIRGGGRTMSLFAWRIEEGAFVPMGEPADLDMGALAVYHLHVDEARGRVLVAGITGAQALSGDGKPFPGIFGLAPDYPLLWKGKGLPFQPHAYLYPLHKGALAITQRDRLARLTLADLSKVQVVDDHPFETPLERVALSPDGHMLAWMWAGADAQRCRPRRGGRIGNPLRLSNRNEKSLVS